MKRIAIIVIALAIVLGFLFWRFGPSFIGTQQQNNPVTLNIVGLWEDENLIKPAIAEYKKVKPNITIEYKYESSKNYRLRRNNEINEGVGPDIFMIHNSWLPMFLKQGQLSEVPNSVMGVDEYKKSFYPVVSDSFVRNNKIYGMSRGIDGLVMYYNEELLRNAGVTTVPRNWREFEAAAIRVTVSDNEGNMQTAGAAMGTTNNVDHWSDILGLLFLQQQQLRANASLEKPDSREGAEVLKFYTDFVRDPSKKIWDVRMENSTSAFARGRLAFYFAPSWRAHELRAINPSLNFKVAPVPQLPGLENNGVSWASFWGYTVSKRSANATEAWEFIKFLSSAQTQQMLYQEAAKVRLFGLPYSRSELGQSLAADPLVGAVIRQGPRYKYWYLASNTPDNNGINEQMIKYYEDAVNKVIQGEDPLSALQTTSRGVQQVLATFGLTGSF